MKGLIDTVFSPILGWLISIRSYLTSMEVPLSRPVNLGDYLGPFALLGPYWITFISTACVLGFIYVVAYVIFSGIGLYTKFKGSIKWW